MKNLLIAGVALSLFAVSAQAAPVRTRPKVEPKVELKLPQSKAPSARTFKNSANTFKGSSALNPNALKAGQTCNGTSLIQDVVNQAGNNRVQVLSAINKMNAVAPGMVQPCMSGEQIKSPQALENLGETVVYAVANARNNTEMTSVDLLAKGLQEAVANDGRSQPLSFEEAKANILGLKKNCQIFAGAH